jgi:hypothetical protein
VVKLIVLMDPLASIPWMARSLSASVHLAFLVMEESVESAVQWTHAHRLLIALTLLPVSSLLMMDLSVFAPLGT